MISIVVGQKGLVTTQGGANWKFGGGGASWVYSGTTPYLIAGGGGYIGCPGGEDYLNTPISTWDSGGGGALYWAPFDTNVTNLGINGDHGKIIITQLFSAAITQTASILCNGLSTAALTSNVSGGLAPYTYTWLPGGGKCFFSNRIIGRCLYANG